MNMEKERIEIVEYGKKMSQDRLCTGTSGNISICNREEGWVAISPSGISYEETKPEDIVILDLEGNKMEGKRKPSSEWELHLNFYKAKPEINAVVHTHSIYCVSFAAAYRPITAVHFLMGEMGAMEIPCSQYVTFGTHELAEEAVRACGTSNAVLLGNHGLVVCGKNIKEAYGMAVDAEWMAQVEFQATVLGGAVPIGKEQMQAVLERFRSYGQ